MEQGTDKFSNYEKFGCRYIKFDGKEFHRTMMLNLMANEANTEIIVNWDADVFISPWQILQAVKEVKTTACVYPYDGRFARVDRKAWFHKLEKHLDVGIFAGQSFKGTRPTDKLSVGGAIVFNRELYFRYGGENEKFISYGPEDVERFLRFDLLSGVKRIQGVLYHMDHFKGANSKCATNPHDEANHQELEKIKAMNKFELTKYISTWK
jgi:predicted glycosyltransferase involved in capsule biosynthesis